MHPNIPQSVSRNPQQGTPQKLRKSPCNLTCMPARAMLSRPDASEDLRGSQSSELHVGFPKIRGSLLGVPTIRTIVFGGLYWGPLILGSYHVGYGVQSLGF